MRNSKLIQKKYKKSVGYELPALDYYIKGFTLIEILITIAIVGIVFGIVITSSAAISQRSRDAQRQADIRNIQSALQQYYADQNFFPDNDGTNAFSLPNSATPVQLNNASGNSTNPAVTKIYSTALPMDPTASTTTPYCYNAFVSSTDTSTNCTSSTCQFYKILAKMENTSSGNGSYSAACSATAYNYQITPL